MIRSVILPVAAPVGASWADFRKVLDTCFRLSTLTANWCVQELYKRDTVGLAKTPQVVKMAAASTGAFAAYTEANKQPWAADWKGAKQAMSTCLRNAHRSYLDHRWDVMVRFKHRLLTYTYPYPYPIPAQSFSIGYTTEAGDTPSGSVSPTVTFTLPGGERFTLRLASRGDFHRQLQMFREVYSGAADRGELALYENGKGDLMCKIAADFTPPAAGSRPPANVCLLRTDAAAFLVAEINGRKPWILNCDHVRRWQAAHHAYRQRTREDAKWEKRLTPELRKGLKDSCDLRCEKHRNRLKNFVHTATDQVADFARRQRVGILVFDAHLRTFFRDGFPWYAVGTKLRDKLTFHGIKVIDTTTTEAEEITTWAASTDRTAASATALAGKRLVAGIRRAGSHPAVTPPTGET